MKFVVSLAFSPVSQLVEIARAAEAAGFDAVSISDHVVHPAKLETPYPYTPDGAPRWEPFTAWPDPWVTIGAMAAVTERLRFLTAVYVLPLRNPFVVAKAAGTAAELSGGRVVLGVGAGWMREEFDLLEQPFAGRGRRMDEMIEILRALWAGGWVEHRGEHYSFDRLEMSPAPEREVPIWVGGISRPALRRAATRGDGWISDLHTAEELRGFVGQLRELRADSSRAGRPFSVAASCKDAFDVDGYRRLGEIGVTHLVTMPWIFYGGATDDVARKVEGIRRFGDDVIAALD